MSRSYWDRTKQKEINTYQKDSSNCLNIAGPGVTVPSEFVKNMEKLSRLAGFDHQNAIIFSVLTEGIKELEKKLSVRIKKLERSIDSIENYIEERTGLEPGKELTDSSESSSSESKDAYTVEEGDGYTVKEGPKESSDDDADEEWYKRLAECHNAPYKKE